jgi:oligopeptide transport system permease protein
MVKHLIPNLAGPLIVLLAIGVPRAIFVEATLSFIGYGVSIGTPSWGSMVQEGYAALALSVPHLMLFPAAAIAVLMLAFTFVADGLRDALDPTSPAGTGSLPRANP